MPLETRTSWGRHDLGFRPWLLTFRGPAASYVPRIRDIYSPGTAVVRIVDGIDESVTVHEQLNDLDFNNGGLRAQRVGSLIEAFLSPPMMIIPINLLPDDMAVACEFRYQLGQLFQPFTSNGMGDRIYYEMELVTCDGVSFRYIRNELRPLSVCLSDLVYGGNSWENSGVSYHLPNSFRLISDITTCITV
jgi:hypothetical protein